MRAVVASLALAAAASASAEPRARSVEECLAYADLALVASTLAKHGIERARTETMLPDMYTLADEQARELARRIVGAAYARAGRMPEEPRTFAAAVGSTCLRSEGRMDAVLGVKL